MHRHLGQVESHLVDQVVETSRRVAAGGDGSLFFGGKASPSHMADRKHFLKVDAEEVENGRGRDLVVNGLENVKLEALDVLDCQLLVSNLLEHHLHFKRVDILVLARNKHCRYANDVKITDLSGLRLALKVAVEERNSQEEGLIVTLKVCEYLNHPVDHASAQGWGDLVLH